MDPVEKFLKTEIKIPSPPAIAVRILDVVKKNNASFGELAGIISADPALTAKILMVANSSFYSLNSKVDNIQRALSIIGVDALKNIALSFVIAGKMKGTPEGGFNFDFFWKRAITAAVGAELLAPMVKHRSDDTFVTALLQDIGIVIMFFCRPEDYSKVLDEKKAAGLQVCAAEKQLFGFDHQELGAEVLKRWGLPESIYMPIRHHHHDSPVPDDYALQTDILLLSDDVSSAYHGTRSTSKILEIKKILGEKFGISDADIANYIDSVAEKSVEILSSFEIDPGDMKPYSQILLEANEELGKLNFSYEQLVLELKQAKEEAESLAQDLKLANARLRELASRDGLTGLYNHRYFQEAMARELSEAVRYGRSFALIMFDIDHFKKINDNYGHPRGDIVIKAISQTIMEMVRNCDIVARYGGEEFAIILPETELVGATILADRVRKSIEALEMVADGLTIKATVSIGVSNFVPKKSPNKKAAMIDSADKALYDSKRNGRNRVTAIDTATT
ncbi:MAG: hypothetical protein A2521_07300 [Deltaproteobacteria bacterium RIFOXYD12_FULL_57_12]|nr:MAG: hypothetical protein A2521_07300 [Deltaproteobacteria bacterium RIFOXYD12_FULL_57_12]